MGIIVALLPLSVLLGAVGVLAYLWAMRSGQYKDLDTPALRALLEDSPTPDGSPPTSTTPRTSATSKENLGD